MPAESDICLRAAPKSLFMKKTKHLNIRALCVLVGLIFLSACQPVGQNGASKTEKSDKPKNIILFIGDGMGPQQIGLLMSYAKQADSSVLKNKSTAFDRVLEMGGELGMSLVHPYQALVVDSAASASQLASGKISGSEMIGLDQQGNNAQSVLEKAKAKGLKTALISDTRLTHATPASFAAHQAHRSMENEIAVQMLEIGPEVMLSGGLRYFLPREVNDTDSEAFQNINQNSGVNFSFSSKRKDSRNLLQEASKKGYQLAFDKQQLSQANGKVLGLFSNSAMADGIQHTLKKDSPERTEPSLKEMTEKALEIISDKPEGYFMMVEAGQIDWAAHDNDTGTMLHEMLKANETLEYLLDWVSKRDDTLLVITADHETGGFGFSYSAHNLPQARQLGSEAFKDRDYQPNFNFGRPEVLEALYQQKLSYPNIFELFSTSEQTPQSLVKIVNENTAFPISEAQAKRVLETQENPFLVEGHKYLKQKRVPAHYENSAFFVFGSPHSVLAKEVSKDQGVVWATATHTSTPVLVFALGKGQDEFAQVLHHTEIGRKLKVLLD